MSLGILALIGLCGLAGPLLSSLGGGAIPAVVGEVAAGVVIGRSGLNVLHTGDATLSFLSDVGFAMLMLSVGMNIPVRERSVQASLPTGAMRALAVAVLAVGAGLLVVQIRGVEHPAVYAVLIASGSAAVVLPIAQERQLAGPDVGGVIAQVTVADIGATIAIPFVLRPAKAGEAVAGTVLVAACLVALYAFSRWLRGTERVRALRREGKRRRWAIDLRVALIVLFGLAWIARRTGGSLLIAGFGAGLMVAAIGGPKRLSTEVLGVAGGFFVPLFFVVLGARLDLHGLFADPAMLGLALALASLTVLAHLLVALATRQRLAAGLLASAQLGVPSAIVALGLSERVLTSAQAAAIIAAALISLAVCAVGAALLEQRAREIRGEPSLSTQTAR
ncbi:MAG: cation:proton antiporter [Solirubrobacterales bacterium]|nr:cation:proton antiporter [Solirubrobacterales bacterium]